MAPVNVAEYERLAAERLGDGIYGYFAGGAGDERTLRENIAAYGRWRLRPRVLKDVSAVSAATTVLGRSVSMPLLVAPTSQQSLAHPDGEAGMARAAAAAGTVYCLSMSAGCTPTEVAAAAPDGRRWFQLYALRDLALTRSLCDEAFAAGFEAVVLTVDATGTGRRERDLRTGFAFPDDAYTPRVRSAVGATERSIRSAFLGLIDTTLTWTTLEQLAASLVLPVIVKGVLTGEDARLACEHGATAVVVSNHGGRQLDGVAATVDVLPEVVDAVDGRVEILVDGGVRRGTDVLVALALGARAVLVGRPPLWGLAVDGEAGVRAVLELLREEIELGMTLLGTPTPADVTRTHVW